MGENREYILEMNHVSKEFPGVKALNDVTLKIRKGTVHALMGENGAGKSTLMKVLIGLYIPDQGEIIFNGAQLKHETMNSVLKKGISMIYQELNPILEMNVAENIYAGREPRGKILLDHKKMQRETQRLLDYLEIDDIHPTDKLKGMTVAKKQMVEIAKAMSYHSKLIIMDEPTSSLTEPECERLFRIVNKMKQSGITFIFISHKMDEIFKISDEITVLRDGCYIATRKATDTNMDELTYMMVGREISQVYPDRDYTPGDTYLSVQNLSHKTLFHDISFDLKRGEILGMAGLVGAGRTEVVESIFGFRKLSGGEIFIDGKKVEIHSPKDAIRCGIALVTEDRKDKGIYSTLSVQDNIVMVSIDAFQNIGILRHQRIKDACQEQKEALSIKTPTLKQTITKLSGGNQQKALIARWLLNGPQIIILDEPTRGIDVGAKSEIYKIIVQLAEQGKSIIMVSSEMPEVLGMSDRILVMHEGELMGSLNRSEATQEKILQMATGIVDRCSASETERNHGRKGCNE